MIKMMNSVIPITHFNKNEVLKILKKVQETGTKIVFKCSKMAYVLMSLIQYKKLMGTLSYYIKFTEPEQRKGNNNSN